MVIGGVLSALAIAIVLFFVVSNMRRADAPTAAPSEQTPQTDTGVSGLGVSSTPDGLSVPARVAPTTPEELLVLQMTRTFVERFRTFSNQNDNRHITDAKALSTVRMQQWIDTQTVAYDPSYSGVTTRVVASEVESLSAANATVRVDVQEHVRTAQGSQDEYRSGSVSLVKQSGVWKIDALYWK